MGAQRRDRLQRVSPFGRPGVVIFTEAAPRWKYYRKPRSDFPYAMRLRK
jgi:hypothetical protein